MSEHIDHYNKETNKEKKLTTHINQLNEEFKKQCKMNYKLINNIEVGGIDTKDYPDFCDAYILSADYDGKPMSDSQLDNLNEDRGFVYECVLDWLF